MLLNQNNRLGVTFNGYYMTQNKIGYAHGTVVNIYIVYKLKNRTVDGPDFTVQNGLFGAVKITKDINTSHYKYSGYGLCTDAKGKFSIGNITNGRNILIFGCDMSFSSHATNKTQNIYVLGNSKTQGINVTTLYAEKLYKTNIAETNKKSVLSLHYYGDNSYFFVNGYQELTFRSVINYKNKNLLCLDNISSDWSLTNSTKTGLYGNVYDFAVDYSPVNSVRTIYDIHRYLMTKHNI